MMWNKKAQKIGTVVLLAAFVFLVILPLAGMSFNNSNSISVQLHAKSITIDGNAQLAAMANGGGDGNKSTPYIIENLSIDIGGTYDDGLVIQSVIPHNESTWGGYFKSHIPPRPYLKVRVANDSMFRLSALVQCHFSVAGQHREVNDEYVELEPRETRVVNIWYSPRRWKIDSRCRVKEYYRTKSAHSNE